MHCLSCDKKPVISLQQGPLCPSCFASYFERKVYATVRKHRLFSKRDVLCVACSGGKDSMSVLHLMHRLALKQRQRLFALGIDEGVEGYRDRQLEDMASYCDANGIERHIITFAGSFGGGIGPLHARCKEAGVSVSRCALCGLLRRRLLNSSARGLGATRIITGHNMDDEAQTMLMNLFRGGPELAARMGPVSGAAGHGAFVPRVKPLYYCTDKETALYARLAKLRVMMRPCPYRERSYRAYVAEKLDAIEADFPGTKSTVVSNLLGILPLLKREYAGSAIPGCRLCGEPSKKGTCAVCRILGASRSPPDPSGTRSRGRSRPTGNPR